MVDKEQLKKDLRLVYDAFDVFVLDLVDKLVLEDDKENNFILEFSVYTEMGDLKELAGSGTMRFAIGDVHETQ